MIRYTCPQQVTIPRRFQEIYVMTVVILSSFLISPKLKYRISIGSSIFVQKKPKKTELGGFPGSEALPFLCMHQFNFALLLEIFGTFCKIKNPAALGSKTL